MSKEEVARVTEPITFYGARSKLQAARIAKGYTVAEFAKLVGYSLSVYQGIEEGASRMGEKMAKKAAALLDLEVEDLTNGSDHPPSNSVPFGSFGAVPEINMGPGMQGQRAKYVPLLSMAQCGVMQAYTDEAYTGEGFVAYSPDDPHAFAVKLAGDSMQPRIEPGDVAVVFPSKTPRNGSIVLARLDDDHGGDVMCKVFQATKDDVTLSSYNPAYPPLTYPRQSFAWIYPVNSVTKVFS
ncbi:MAG: LexA family transcriptional regulator [Prosthecobacter sp.]|nr:LexA family transcriptional regulator [Prosthecobacter sp.]